MADGSSSIEFEGDVVSLEWQGYEGLEAVFTIHTATSLWHPRLCQYVLPFIPGTLPSSSLSGDRRPTGSILENKARTDYVGM